MFEYDKALATRQPAAINVVRSQIDQADAQIKLLDEATRPDQAALVDFRPGRLRRPQPDDRRLGAARPGFVRGRAARIPIASFSASTSAKSAESSPARPAISSSRRCRTKRCPSRWTRSRRSPTPNPAATSSASRACSPTIPRDLRPGMEGVGKIEIGRRSLAWIWLHPLIDWAADLVLALAALRVDGHVALQ